MRRISATEASRNFSRLLDVVEQGKSFKIVRGGRRIATIAPVKRYTGAEFTAILEKWGPDPELADAIEDAKRFGIDQEPRYFGGT